MGLFQKISRVTLAPSVFLGNLITRGASKVTGKAYGKQTTKKLSKTTFGKVLGTAIAGTAVALAGFVAAPFAPAALSSARVAAPKILKSGVKSIGKLTPKKVFSGILGTAFIAGGGLKLAPAVFKKTKEATQTAVPVLLGEEPLTSDSAKDVLKTAGIITGAGAAAFGAGIIVKNILEKKEEKAIETAQITQQPLPAVTQQPTILPTKVIPTNEGIPVTPETTTITTGKRKYKRSKPRTATINNRVNVIVKNSYSANRTTKKYINVPLLAN